MSNCHSVLERAAAWFLRSGIQEPSGGVARYYRSDLFTSARVSTEITGYAVSFLVYAFERTGRTEILDAALRAARFLTRKAWNKALGLFPFEHSSNGSHGHSPAYFFDSGIIARGLLRAWRATGETEFLNTAVAAGRGMLEHFRGECDIHPILALPDRRPLAYEPRWSASPGCYQLKSAMAWQDLFEATGFEQFGSAYEATLQRALATHGSFLPGDPSSEKVMDRLHAYLYFLEGLLPRAGRPDCAQALAQGMECVPHYMREIAPSFARSDVYAQLLRVRLYTNHPEVAADLAAIDQFQMHSVDPRLDGGFGFGTREGRMLPFVNPVSTAFCAQAIDQWRLYQTGEFPSDLLALV